MAMESPGLDTFIADLPKYHHLNSTHQENALRLSDISRKFLKKAGIDQKEIRIDSERTIVLESGHQPNFLPHAGTWKKAILLNRIHEQLIQNGHPSIAFFGLADQNISTARLLSKNQIPDLNKNGFTKIGFKIRDEDKQRSFNRVKKPAVEQWQKEIDRLQQHYCHIFQKTKFGDEGVRAQRNQILDILWTSYDRADNFAELNSLIFARISRELFGINLLFFLYSDMHHGDFFLDESKTILSNLQQFNQIYNRQIIEKDLEIPQVLMNHLPFWYECECGIKLDLYTDTTGECTVTCPGCMKNYRLHFGTDFENLKIYYDKMDFNAVSRNIIMAQGLGVTLFLSGTGGSSVYGQISDQISKELGFHRPISLAWQSKDYYLGMMHKIILWEMMKTFALAPDDFFNGSTGKKTGQKFSEIVRKISDCDAGSNQKEKQYWKGVQNSAKTLLEYTQKIFSSTPSFIDILANFRHETIMALWEKALRNSVVRKNGYMHVIHADINYPVIFFQDKSPEEIPALYDSVKKIGA